MSKSGDPTSGLIQGSGDPTLSSALVDELDLYDFLKDEVSFYLTWVCLWFTK